MGSVRSEGVAAAVRRLPLVPGVYRFLDSAGGVLYIGRATTLRSRVASYWSDLRGRAHLAPMVAQVARVQAVACDSAHEAAWLERNLLTAALPPWNRTRGGQEVPVCIVMDSRPASPRLSVAHLPAPELPAGRGQCFGPYLGGRRVRQAVKGLSRCMPLAYTADGLRGADLDIARARRVTQADRPDFVAVISAALRRDPEAVERARIRLEQLRERAAQALAFELAARITEEIQALEWVTCPQRASSPDARGVHGLRVLGGHPRQLRGKGRSAVGMDASQVPRGRRRTPAGPDPSGLGRFRPAKLRARGGPRGGLVNGLRRGAEQIAATVSDQGSSTG